jgi:hypothetical protein
MTPELAPDMRGSVASSILLVVLGLVGLPPPIS